MAMVPHERSLVKRLDKRPFALIGVNGDGDRADVKKRLAKSGITWRSFWNGGRTGTISTAWKVDGWPMTYVLDAEGRVRARDVRGEAMDRAVDKLLAELEQNKR
jgi:hypothetical protein